MKTRLLIIIAFGIFLSLVIFIFTIYSLNLEMELQLDSTGGGTIELDPKLSPSYAPYYYQILKFNSIFIAGPIMLGIISLAFLVPNIILKIKKIPTRKYMLVIGAIILIFFGISYMQNGLSVLTLEHFEQQSDYRIILIGALIPIGIGSVPFTLGVIVLKKAILGIRK